MKFLKQESDKKSLGQEHSDYLGLDIPKDFFTRSKKDIRKLIADVEETRKPVVRFKASYLYPIAASLLLVFGLTFWMQKNISETPIEVVAMPFYSENSESLISSLFIDDSNMDEFLNEYVFDEIIVETAITEYNIDALFINSFFVEDSLIDNYFYENLLESMLL